MARLPAPQGGVMGRGPGAPDSVALSVLVGGGGGGPLALSSDGLSSSWLDAVSVFIIGLVLLLLTEAGCVKSSHRVSLLYGLRPLAEADWKTPSSRE